MGYRNLTCHHLESTRLSFSLGQCAISCIACFGVDLSCFGQPRAKMPRLPTTIAVQAVFSQMTRFATFVTVPIVLSQMANSSTVIASRCTITTTQMSSFALTTKWPMFEVPSNLFIPLNCPGRLWFPSLLFSFYLISKTFHHAH